MQSWALGLAERLMLLKLWFLPLTVQAARGNFSGDSMVNMLKTCLTGWDVVHAILVLPLSETGLSLPQPRTFLYLQYSVAFLSLLP